MKLFKVKDTRHLHGELRPCLLKQKQQQMLLKWL